MPKDAPFYQLCKKVKKRKLKTEDVEKSNLIDSSTDFNEVNIQQSGSNDYEIPDFYYLKEKSELSSYSQSSHYSDSSHHFEHSEHSEHFEHSNQSENFLYSYQSENSSESLSYSLEAVFNLAKIQILRIPQYFNFFIFGPYSII